MMLHEAFDAFGKPFPYYPQLCHRLDISVNACVFLCYLAWRTKPGETWVHISSETAEKHTGLSVKEQVTARRALVEKKCIVEEYRRLEHQLCYKLGECDLSQNIQKTPENSPNAEREFGETPKGSVANRPNGSSTNKGINRVIKAAPVMPQELRTEQFQKTWEEWVQYRKERKPALTPCTIKRQFTFLARLGPQKAVDVINESILNSWQGLFEKKINGNGQFRKHGNL